MVYLIWCHDGEIKVIFSRAPFAQNLFFFFWEKEKPYGYMCWHDFSIISTTGYCSKTNFCSHLSIWKHRNNKVWSNIVETTQQIGTRAEAFLSSWKNAKETRTQTTTPSTHTDIDKWKLCNRTDYMGPITIPKSHHLKLSYISSWNCILDEIEFDTNGIKLFFTLAFMVF